MKTTKTKFLSTLLLAFAVVMASCADLSVQNTNEPTAESVLGDPANTLKLLSGGYYDFSTTIVTSWGVAMHMFTDQATSTNLFRNYWNFSEEPRLQLNNTTTYGATATFTSFFGGFNSSVATSNIFIKSIEVDGNSILDGATDITNDVLAQAYFLRGLARGYLGLMYDQGYLIDENFDAATDEAEFVPYTTIIDAAVADLDKAITLADASSTFTFNVMPNSDDVWTKAQFLDIANSFAARIAAGKARTASEAASLDWAAIKAYADAGLGGPNAQSTLTDFSPSNVGSSGEFANYLADWLNFIVTGSPYDDPATAEDDRGAGYNPVDVKQIHLLDPTYPTAYPADQASASVAGLAPATSDDPRLAYFQYTPNPGYLNPSRNATLFTNYFSFRNFAGNDWWPSIFKVTLITETEVDLLRAEAQLMSGNAAGAAATLNASSSGTEATALSWDLPGYYYGYVAENSLAGGHTMTGAESTAEFQWALLREYSVELDLLGGSGLQWFFMRRHDLLQAGTALHYAVPGSELEILGLENYTFGGADDAGQAGTASGANTWTDLANKAGLKVRAKVANPEHVVPAQMDNAPAIDAPKSEAKNF
tara:strand:+ start:323335 stop:325116 length:1782 start_codon:yes stop_codon:yes gene_type:complete